MFCTNFAFKYGVNLYQFFRASRTLFTKHVTHSKSFVVILWTVGPLHIFICLLQTYMLQKKACDNDKEK